MNLYFMDIVAFDYSALIEYIFSVLSSVIYATMKILIDKYFFGDTVYEVLRVASYKWNNRWEEFNNFEVTNTYWRVAPISTLTVTVLVESLHCQGQPRVPSDTFINLFYFKIQTLC